MLTKDLAICLRTTSYSETSQVITLFTKQSGRIDAIAKGSRRAKSAFDGPLEIFSFGRVVISISASGGLSTLTEFQQQPIFLSLRKNLDVLNCALFGAELVNSFTHDHDPHPELFDCFVQFLTDVQHGRDRAEALSLLILFQLVLLRQVGLGPVLEMCVNCKKSFTQSWRGTYFCHSANGLVCADCEGAFVDRTALSKSVAATLADFKHLADAPIRTLNELEKILIDHVTGLLNRRPRMAKHFLPKPSMRRP